MTPADFTIEFYRKCLSQHNWTAPFNDNDVENNKLLYRVAKERGGEFLTSFLDAYSNAYVLHQHVTHFPVAVHTATETTKQTPKTNTPMNALLKDIYETLIKPLVDAIDRNTAAKGIVFSNDATVGSCSSTAPTEAQTEPKKRGPKAKAYVETGVNTPEPENLNEKLKPLIAVDDLKVVQEEEPYMSGPELCELMRPLNKTQFTAKLVEFRDNEVGFNKPTREMTDPAMLRKMEAKIREFLTELENQEA